MAKVSDSVIPVLSGLDGWGLTTNANNLAVTLNDGGAPRVCLVDLDLTLGDIASAVGLSGSTSRPTAVLAIGVPRTSFLFLRTHRRAGGMTDFGPSHRAHNGRQIKAGSAGSPPQPAQPRR